MALIFSEGAVSSREEILDEALQSGKGSYFLGSG
jgi:hypothetical protein